MNILHEPSTPVVTQKAKTIIRCSYCHVVGHNIKGCSQKRYDDSKTPDEISELIRMYDVKFRRECIVTDHVDMLLREINCHLLIHLWRFLFPDFELPKHSKNGGVSIFSVEEMIGYRYCEIIRCHPQHERRSKIYKNNCVKLEKLSRDHHRHQTSISEQIRELGNQISQLRNESEQYRMSYSDNRYKLSQIPPLKEFRVCRLATNQGEPLEEGEIVEEEPSCYSCPICFNDNIHRENVVFMNCKHHLCYDCMLSLVDNQETPSCPLCRQHIQELQSKSDEKYQELKMQFTL